MNTKNTVILYSCQGGADEHGESHMPITIYSGDDIDTDARNVIRLAAKHLAQGDFSSILAKEELLLPRLGEVKLLLAAGNKGGFDAEGQSFIIQPFLLIDGDKLNSINFLMRQERFIHFNKDTALYEDASKIAGNIPSHLIEICDLVDSNAYGSPFIFPSPFVWEGEDLYAVERLTRKKSGPFSKADWSGTYYLVYTPEKGGIVGIDGKVIAECIYDRAYNQNGYVVLCLGGKWGLFSPWNDLLVSPEFDDIELPEDDEACLMVRKGDEWGYLDSTGRFHRKDDIDISLTYL